MSTKFNHKQIRKGTSVAPDGNTCNQIDHILINQNKSSMIQDVRTLRRLNCDSDHYLLKIGITQKIVRVQQNSNIQRKQWNRKNLQNKEKINQYRQSSCNKLEKVEEHQDINTERQQIKDSVLDAAKEVIQKENKKSRNELWDDECRKAMEEKNLARMKCINRRTRTNQNDYMQKRKIASGICKRKKKEWLNDKTEQIEEANRKNESRKFYKNSAFFNKKPTQLIPLSKDSNGVILSEKTLVLEKWKQYFNKILNL
jgi:hypothetical protein